MLGDFNIDTLTLKYELSDSINNFIDTLTSNFLLPHILLPARISKTSTSIGNSFSKLTSLEEIESVSVTSTFSDHFQQSNFLKDLSAAKPNISSYDWRKIESYKFISDFDQTDYEQILCTEKRDVNFSMN